MAQSRRAILTSKRYSQKTKEQVCREIRWEYYKANRERFIDNIVQHRETILQLLLIGVEVETAFAPYIKKVDAINAKTLSADTCQLKAA